MHFGASLRLLRLQSGWSLRDLSASVGVSPAYLSRVEHGHDAPPTPDRLHAIAHALGVSGELLAALAGRPRAEATEASLAADALHREVLRRRLTPAQVGRVLEFIERSFPTSRAARPGTVTPLLATTRIVRGARAATVEDAVDLAAMRMAPPGAAAGIAEALRRPGPAAFAVGSGLLLPHTSEGPVSAGLVLLGSPITAPTPDDQPVRAVLALTGVPPGAAGLSLLGHATQLADTTLLTALEGAADDDEVLRLVGVFEGG